MTPHQKRRLERLAKALDEAQTLIRELLHESTSDVEQEPTPEFDARAVLTSLRTVERGAAEERLGAMKQHELGAVFVEAGGPSSDKKKPKVWLVEQILWRVFDFERGHEAIRGKGAGES
ncbi:hypothetical protein [Thauera sp. Sel9]|uniref:hypothetical protein n=1 Tax=Thauera sp. Sel9 TaxID=2974299 RepID=UPI0021E11D59|nr:hypothetical protein [Thauera sp. Sel9]MCV2219903.1 hypothetical protein [Thauera sp. Sel9]